MPENIHDWSVTASDNATADSAINWQENQTPGSVNGSARAMMAALAKFLKDNNGTKSTAGADPNYTLATPNTTYAALLNGLTICFRASFANTTNSSLNLNNLGAKLIKVYTTSGESFLSAGMIQAGGHYIVQYDTSADGGNGAWLLLNPTRDGALVGEIKIWPTNSAPAGWLFCNGQAVSRTTYANLFAVVATTYGAGDGSTTFNVPDLRGRAPFGNDTMGASAANRITAAGSGIVGATTGAAGGAETVTLSVSQIPSHTHGAGTLGADSGGAHTHTVNSGTGVTGADGVHTHTVATGTGVTSTNGAHTHAGSTADSGGAHTHSLSANGSAVSHAHALSNAGGSATLSTHGGHTHGAGTLGADSGGSHTHGITDPGHGHTIPTLRLHTGNSGTIAEATTGTGASRSTDGATTGITINAGGAHTHTVSGSTASDGSHTHTLGGSTEGSGAVALSGNTDSGGAHTHTLTIVADGAHNHTVSIDNSAAHTHSVTIDSGGAHTHTVSGTSGASGGGAAHNTMPPALILNFIIKA